MPLDYYGILSVKRNCNQNDVKAAYRRLALKYNPQRHDNDEDLKKVFTLIAEAYDVLVDPERRAVFDQYGEEGLKKGVPGPDYYIQPYIYHGEPIRTYEEFFGTDNPYANLLDFYENPPPMFDSPLGKGYKDKDQDIIRPLALSLFEVFNGGIKKMKIQRLVFTDEKCNELKLREKILSIPIERGIYQNTRILFKEEGDQGPTRIPADVIFVTEDRPHETYVRTGLSDLLTVQQITFQEALCGYTVVLTSVDGRTLRIPINDVVHPTYEKVLEGEGLPIPMCPDTARGNLIIRFQVTYPLYFSKKTRKAFAEAFKANELEEEAFKNIKCGEVVTE